VKKLWGNLGPRRLVTRHGRATPHDTKGRTKVSARAQSATVCRKLGEARIHMHSAPGTLQPDEMSFAIRHDP
jgi:hypothetical protein